MNSALQCNRVVPRFQVSSWTFHTAAVLLERAGFHTMKQEVFKPILGSTKVVMDFASIFLIYQVAGNYGALK